MISKDNDIDMVGFCCSSLFGYLLVFYFQDLAKTGQGRLRNSSQGTVAASDFYAQEMQSAAEDAAADLEREIRKDIETVCGDKLLEMCTAAGTTTQVSAWKV